ncbi:MAG TPA: YnfA family protein [Hyphomicrobiaceae bacterium]|nr:YnfA family protein [Hyphomicrobiaceae bacterium]
MRTLAIYVSAAVAEIAGCFAFWVWLRAGGGAWLPVAGLMALGIFAWLLTLTPVAAAGRSFAVYGGIYIAAALVWLWVVEGQAPDRWDAFGAALSILGALVIFAGPRG